ncbi:hypothetical protein DE146DRAFT_654329 [Phaeosphaeria sp. MPI-PUGE-AT-0046c]|nr:hypothetical protein DE146DRAFT_654329 [Phaeosphaeria sp. MPI-PUGE-AT-0046c]
MMNAATLLIRFVALLPAKMASVPHLTRAVRQYWQATSMDLRLALAHRTMIWGLVLLVMTQTATPITPKQVHLSGAKQTHIALSSIPSRKYLVQSPLVGTRHGARKNSC